MEEKEPSYTVGNANSCNHYGKHYGSSLKNQLPYDPAIPPSSIYPEETKAVIQKNTCTPIFTASTVRHGSKLSVH